MCLDTYGKNYCLFGNCTTNSWQGCQSSSSVMVGQNESL
ncbi:hypothetical protein O53_1626 [Microcystis aeruginosa TAIHU98]|uniref:Uncharacterized protein n=2 Tax=Microcystis aeruginosa TaxID=1126 RepID=L7EDE9_MICAE|nr:hypothetical protein BH695_2914 [Microcystis aeruginosa PCC 7806SL]ELP57014.1 hypothetical protein O53_1626 [Microcystis aeruginosa TAIHU98]ELS46219.1 hypothetical protein C789_3975 [Microcystis aeruginosa FACHB-905 = DIANCHI905]